MFVMDYSRMNGLTKKDSYPLPCIDDLLRVIGYDFSYAIDLDSG